MARIVYGVQGEGRGHSSRSTDFEPFVPYARTR